MSASSACSPWKASRWTRDCEEKDRVQRFLVGDSPKVSTACRSVAVFVMLASLRFAPVPVCNCTGKAGMAQDGNPRLLP